MFNTRGIDSSFQLAFENVKLKCAYTHCQWVDGAVTTGEMRGVSEGEVGGNRRWGTYRDIGYGGFLNRIHQISELFLFAFLRKKKESCRFHQGGQLFSSLSEGKYHCRVDSFQVLLNL